MGFLRTVPIDVSGSLDEYKKKKNKNKKKKEKKRINNGRSRHHNNNGRTRFVLTRGDGH